MKTKRRKTKKAMLFLDLETAPNLGWTWGKYEQNVIDFEREVYLLSFSWKWEGGKVQTKALPDYPLFKKDKTDDKMLVLALWQLFDQADVVVCHNGDSFDIRVANERFVALGMNPPSPYKSVDTKKVAKRYFRFNSNKLDDLGRTLGLGRKLPHTGFDLWKRCMVGDKKAWSEMREYNEQDIHLLEKVYLKLRAWATTHPAMGMSGCPKCGSDHIQQRGWSYTQTRRKKRLQCQSCGGWFQGKSEKLTAEEVEEVNSGD